MHPDLKLLRSLALSAGEIGLKYFKSDNEVWYKNGSSPVSEADKEIDSFLRTTFAEHRPQYGWLSEETEDNSDRLDQDTIIIADPIDGTRGFIAGRNEWCIAISIVTDSRPVHAILHCPAMQRTLLASKGTGLIIEESTPYQQTSRIRPLVTGSKKIIEVLNANIDKSFDVLEFIPSLAYRLALVATNELDGAYARGGASEWDVAAADLILEEADCKLTDQHGNQLSYNQNKVTMPSLVAASKSNHENILNLAKSTGILK